MTKTELSEVLHEVGVPVHEGITSKSDTNKYPRILYWPFVEQKKLASGGAYYNEVTYQISLFARTPQCEEFKKMRKLLEEKGIYPVFEHEYIEKDSVFSKTWHTRCAVDVTEEGERSGDL